MTEQQKLRELLENSSHIVFFGGAGVSTEIYKLVPFFPSLTSPLLPLKSGTPDSVLHPAPVNATIFLLSRMYCASCSILLLLSSKFSCTIIPPFSLVLSPIIPFSRHQQNGFTMICQQRQIKIPGLSPGIFVFVHDNFIILFAIVFSNRRICTARIFAYLHAEFFRFVFCCVQPCSSILPRLFYIYQAICNHDNSF